MDIMIFYYTLIALLGYLWGAISVNFVCVLILLVYTDLKYFAIAGLVLGIVFFLALHKLKVIG